MLRFSVLVYHMVAEPKAPIEHRFAIPPRRFASHITTLVQHGYTCVSLDQAESWLHGRAEIPDRALALTFDDGFADNFTEAYPVLRQYRIPATIFVTVNTIGAENVWMSATGFPSRRMLSWDQIRAMHAGGVSFGSHTLNHPRLSSLNHDAAGVEIRDAKRTLEEKLGVEIKHFAYPYGDCNGEIPSLVRAAGHTLACSTRSGFNRPGCDPLLLRRIEVYGTDSRWQLLQKLFYGTSDAGLFKPVRYYWRRLVARFKAG